MPADQTQRDRGEACECVHENDWPDDTEPCMAEFTGDTDLLCSRPEGHDGPHSACNVVEHPHMVWVQGD